MADDCAHNNSDLVGDLGLTTDNQAIPTTPSSSWTMDMRRDTLLLP
jgi:hypothetical protein